MYEDGWGNITFSGTKNTIHCTKNLQKSELASKNMPAPQVSASKTMASGTYHLTLLLHTKQQFQNLTRIWHQIFPSNLSCFQRSLHTFQTAIRHSQVVTR